jgi:hypothetical protein
MRTCTFTACQAHRAIFPQRMVTASGGSHRRCSGRCGGKALMAGMFPSCAEIAVVMFVPPVTR